MLTVRLPTPNEVVGINEPFTVVGGTDLINLQEVTVQVDAGPVMRANITPVTHPGFPPRAIFTGWGMVATLGPHTVTVKALYWEGRPPETVTVDIQALGEPE